MAMQKKQLKEKQQNRNWLELPNDVMANILHRVGAVGILENAEKVCTTWCKICKEPSLWRVIYMNRYGSSVRLPSEEMIFKNAVDRSQGELVDITIVNFMDEDLHYVADRSSQLRRLEIVFLYLRIHRSLNKALMKFHLLEELNLYQMIISKEDIETLGRCCPMLRTLKVNKKACGFACMDDEIAIAIGENLSELKHLELIGNSMLNTGLEAILNGCRHLKLLDLRKCLCIYLKGSLGKKCSKKIKCLKLPDDSLDGCRYIYQKYIKTWDWQHDYGDYRLFCPN